MATAHIESNLEDIAPVVLMPGDPLRAKYIAENFLEDVKQVNKVRNMFGYTGTYKGKKVTVFASGMGIPSIGIYKEVSSASNARDYQARRGMMRYRDKATGKTKYMHTLNASGLATSRIFPAILEQYQQEDGSVLVPEVLQPFMGGIKVLKPVK